MREKKQREAMGLGQRTGKSSTYSDSPQPAPNSIKWASVNGYQSSPADADPYHQRQSLDGEESSDDFELSSAPDSDHEGKSGKSGKHFEVPARSTPSQARGGVMPDIPLQQPPIVPILVQEGPRANGQANVQANGQANGQAQPNFDVLAAQSRGQPIAPRQPPPQQSSFPTSTAMFDDRPPPPPPPPPPEFRPTLRSKRGREPELVDSELRSSNIVGKRRKHQVDAAEPSATMFGNGEDYAMQFNPPQQLIMPLLPPRVPQDSELDEMCIRFRESFRATKTYYEEEMRISKDLYDASLGRANARARHALQKLDEVSLLYSEQNKDARVSSQLELDHLDMKLTAEQAENKRLRQELAKYRDELAAKDALQRERGTTAADNFNGRDMQITTRPEHSSNDTLQQELRAARENAQRADTANNLLNEVVAKMRLDVRDTYEKFHEVKEQHEGLTSKIEHLASQNLEDLPNKTVKKYILDVKDVDEGLSDKIKEAEESYTKPQHLSFGTTQHVATPVANGSISEGLV
ncbi:MAG: hypothetical protein Q9166_002496 [cf. Caloplaca sp. 2 TL-2023]